MNCMDYISFQIYENSLIQNTTSIIVKKFINKKVGTPVFFSERID